MRLAVYDIATGRILQVLSGSQRSLGATLSRLPSTRSSLMIAPGQSTRDRIVRDGKLVPAAPDPALAMKRLRGERDRRLRLQVDVFTPLRLEALSAAQRDQLRAYRQALLNLPDTVIDTQQPDWPVPPAFLSP